jgi:hypothetical protein
VQALKDAVLFKGSNEFMKQELIGILVFKLRIMGVKEAKKLIDDAIEKGVIEVIEDKFVINTEKLEEEEEKIDVFNEMLSYIAKELGWNEFEILEELKEFSKRYGDLDKRIVLYLYGLDKGLNMFKFRDKLDLG